MIRSRLLSVLAAVMGINGVRIAEAGIVRFNLENGLTVILRPVADSSLVACVTVFDIGNAHDPPDQSGLGHLIEHLYVTAAAGDRPAATAQEWMSRYGGQVNAQTGRDYTVIATVFPAENLESELTEAADRMGRLRIEPADLDREKPRMQTELDNMYGGIPTLAAQNLVAQAADPPAEGARKGGRMEQIGRIAVEQARQRLRYYKPVNATLVLVGGFDAAGARRVIEDRFGMIVGGRPAPDPRRAPAPLLGRTQRVTVPRPAFGRFPDAIAAVAYRAPAPDSDLYPPFLILMGRLLQRAMPEIQLAMQRQSPVMPMYYAPLDMPNLVFFNAVPGDDQTDDEAVAALRRRVTRWTTIPDQEQVNQFFLMQHYGPMLGLIELPERAIGGNPYLLAFSLGRCEQFGLEAAALKARLDRVSVDELRRCAQDVFGADRSAAVVVRIE